MTGIRLENVIFSIDEISNIIRDLDTNKAHGQDKVSISMLRIFGNAICKPLDIIYKEYLNLGVYPLEWKKRNILPIHNNGDKQCLKNYRPVSLFPICVKPGDFCILPLFFNNTQVAQSSSQKNLGIML